MLTEKSIIDVGKKVVYVLWSLVFKWICDMDGFYKISHYNSSTGATSTFEGVHICKEVKLHIKSSFSKCVGLLYSIYVQILQLHY